MKAPYQKDRKQRKNFSLSEQKLLCLKALKKNDALNCKWWARHKIDTFLPMSSNNRCLITNRKRSTSRDYKLSRLEFRRWARSFKLPGVQKESW